MCPANGQGIISHPFTHSPLNYSHPQIRQTARRIPILCAVYFVVFCFCYLYYLQRDVLAQAQYALSGGVTVYHPVLAALLCTLLFTLVGIFLTRAMHRWLPLRWLTLAWFPSFMFLAALTHWRFPQYGDSHADAEWLPYLLFALLWLCMLLVGHFFPDSSKEKASLSTYAWPNALQLLAFTSVCVSLGNTDVVLHHTLRAGQYLSLHDYDAVLHEAQWERHPSPTLTAMTALALSQNGEMGDRLFAYPQPYGSEGLLPSATDSLLCYDLLRAVDRHLGYRKSERTPIILFLQVINQKPHPRPAARDYLLCGLLLDRRLGDFEHVLSSTLSIDHSPENRDSLIATLPYHYREALSLHRSLQNEDDPDTTMNASLQDFMALYHSNEPCEQREFLCAERFGHTYWFYYFFEKQ